MKLRKEKSGAHYFNRKNGLHILFDEVKFKSHEISKVPRTMSIALTNRCNQNCDYCYCKHGNDDLEYDYLVNLAKFLDEHGCLEITFGGGEPFLHPDILNICKAIWSLTKLGISITTNGQLLSNEILEEIKSYISSLRISIDVLEPDYSILKKVELPEILNKIIEYQNKIPIGINIIIRPSKVGIAQQIIDHFKEVNIANFLLIPEHVNGEFVFTENDWRELNKLISDYKSKVNIIVTYNATKNINIKTLDTEVNGEYLFMHISADKYLRSFSYEEKGVKIENEDDFEKIMIE